MIKKKTTGEKDIKNKTNIKKTNNTNNNHKKVNAVHAHARSFVILVVARYWIPRYANLSNTKFIYPNLNYKKSNIKYYQIS